MKKFVPFIVLSLFVILLLSLCGPILTKRQQEEAQRAYEAERHLVVFSDLPQDVNDGLAQLFYEQKHLRVQIYSKSDGDIRQALKTDSGVKPDILIASEDNLREQKKNGILQPYASPVTDKVLPSMKDPEQLWNGLWYNPMVFIVSQSYYERRGMQIRTWDDLLTDPEMVLAFPDLASMDMAGEFLCSFVEMRGIEDSERYLRSLQGHVSSYSKSMSANVRRVASGEADMGVADAAVARQYRHDGAPIYILYPRDGTSYWLTGVAVTNWCEDGELTNAFIDWLYSFNANAVLWQKHIFLSDALPPAKAEVDAKGQEIALFPVKKQYSDQGRRDLQAWWIKSVRFGKEK